jgi:ubiquinone/menaquinone biosynthesis C-methylase UbiE
MWEGFFDPALTLRKLGFVSTADDVVDFGCGYGTFAIAAAKATSGTVHALDIDPQMVALTAAKASSLSLHNIKATQTDFVTAGTGLGADSVGYAMQFNILHAEDALGLLAEAFRVLRPGGVLGIIHWIYDANTPRGPDLSIRPRPEQCSAWAEQVGFVSLIPLVALPPHHFGLAVQKPR